MRRELLGMLVVICLASCGRPEQKPAGFLDRYGTRGDALHRNGDRLYYAYSESIYSLDVSDSDHLTRTDSDAWADVTCADACAGYYWLEGYVHVVARDSEVAKVTLPNGAVPVWVFEAAEGDFHSFSSVQLGEDSIAIVQGSGTGPTGRLLVVRIAPSPALLGTLDWPTSLITAAQSSGFLFSTASDLGDPNALFVFDVRNPTPVLHAEVDLGLEPGYEVDALAARDSDLFVTSSRSEDQSFQFNWYRFSSDFSSIREIESRTDIDATSSEDRKPVFYDRFLFVPGIRFGDEGEGVAVYAIDDTAAGLTLISHTPKSSPGAIFVDNPHRVAYFGGGGIWAMDLDYVLGLSD